LGLSLRRALQSMLPWSMVFFAFLHWGTGAGTKWRDNNYHLFPAKWPQGSAQCRTRLWRSGVARSVGNTGTCHDAAGCQVFFLMFHRWSCAAIASLATIEKESCSISLWSLG
jgi:hypothetical protein